MNCTELHERLADYLGGELDAAEAARVETHLASCAACAREVAEHRQTLSTLAMLNTVDRAEADRRTRRLVVVTRRPAWMRWGWAALRTAAVLAVGVLLGRAAFPKSAADGVSRPVAEVAPPAVEVTPPVVAEVSPAGRPVRISPVVAAAGESAVHPRWIVLARECGRGQSSFACQLAILAETARQ